MQLSFRNASRALAFQAARPGSSGRVLSVVVLAKKAPAETVRKPVASADTDDVGTVGLAAAAAGLVANPVVAWSLFTLKTTGAGLPPGPGGALGALGEALVLWLVQWQQ